MLVTLAACGGGDGNGSANGGGAAPAAPVLSSIGIDASSSSVLIGGTTQLTPVGRDQRGIASSATYAWSSSNEAIAVVSASGVVTGVATGAASVKVVATSGAASAAQSVVINVMPLYTGPAPPINVLVNDPHRDSYPNLSQHEPSLGIFGSRIVVSWIDKSIENETIRGVNFGVGYGNSSDGGGTFVDRGRLGSTSWGFDPSVAVDRAGHFFIGRGDLDNSAVGGTLQPDRVAIFKSNDGGMTFPQAVGVTGNTRATPGINDKSAITADNSGGRFDGNVYVSWSFASQNVLNILFSKSGDGGASYSPPQSLSSGPLDQGALPATGPDGEVYVVWLENANRVLVRKSIDGGETFKAAVTVAQVDAIGVTNARAPAGCGPVLNGDVRARSLPAIAVDRSGGAQSGTVYVAFSGRGVGSDNADVFLVSSRDGGTSWGTPVRINDDATTTDQWLPSVVVAPNGTVAVSWYDRRLDGQNMLIDVFMRTSAPGGAAFGSSRKISSVAFPPPPQTFNCYFSSYSYMGADASSFYLVWTDTRMLTRGVADPNVFFAKVSY
ncbi:hypothetical protein BH11GEM1_BH11GEM1_31680 [soil metagenome]